ncbi:gluconate kinase [Rubrobacter xylanophilus]|uniref:Gluconate kinase n=1 Tax=Rubrobacter xylanophilus TaxID=49319 RepID=A0A510HGQ0_9ACTN|nr:gluconokinase [Rubrobacter xylanophilus]BBL79156.1 gluconate kinase [Rubrobacter xylanophilus]
MPDRNTSPGAVLAVDVGSSSVRAELYDLSGSPVEGSGVNLELKLSYTPDGGATVDADVLVELAARAIDAALSRSGGRRVRAVALCTFWHSLLGLDGSGRPVTPVLTWADRRAAGAASRLRERLDERAVHRRTGCVLHSSYWPAKLLWMREERPKDFERSRRWVSPGEYLYLRLFGELRVGTSMASATGLFLQNEQEWDRELIGALPVEAGQLSPISDEPFCRLRGEWARRWPDLREVPWFPAAGDGACSNVGCGATAPSRPALMVGTSGAMRILWRAEATSIPPGLWCYRADGRRFVMGGALSNGGNLVEWLRGTLRLPGPEETERLLGEMEPDGHGLTFLPLLAGERGPGWSDRANGVVAGLSMASTPVDILRAAMEAVAYRFAAIADLLEETFPGREEVIATGGGLLGSRTWAGIMADVLGTELTLSGVREASSRGAALLALETLGELEIEEAEVPRRQTLTPDAARHEVYRRAMERQGRLYELLVTNPLS